MTTVTAALIQKDGQILVCRRRADQDHAGKWEFPGGKTEPGESAPEALRRELKEELGIVARIGPEVTRYCYRYPGRQPIELIFLRVTEYDGELDFTHFHDVRWVESNTLPQLDFLEGDIEFVKELARSRDADPT